ncbi:MAG: hypothetical protein RIS70_870, partial [Planctomycetota bacterium]
MKQWWIACGFATAILGATAVCMAEEPASQFLDKLRQAGYFDAAIDYLDVMQESPLAPASFKEVLPYERAVTLLKQARSNRDFAVREKQLDAANQALKQFLTERSDHPLLADAQRESANVVLERAHLKMERSKKPTEAANKALLLGDARKLYDEAYQLFTAQHTQLKTQLEAMPKQLDPKRDAKRYEAREQMQKNYLQAQVLAAAVREEAADTVPKGSDD